MPINWNSMGASVGKGTEGWSETHLFFFFLSELKDSFKRKSVCVCECVLGKQIPVRNCQEKETWLLGLADTTEVMGVGMISH